MVQAAVVKKAATKVGTVILGSAAMLAIDKIDSKVNTPEKRAELEQLKQQRAEIKKRKEEQKKILNNMKKVQKIQLKQAKLEAELAEIVGNNTIDETEQEWIPESQFVEDCD